MINIHVSSEYLVRWESSATDSAGIREATHSVPLSYLLSKGCTFKEGLSPTSIELFFYLVEDDYSGTLGIPSNSYMKCLVTYDDGSTIPDPEMGFFHLSSYAEDLWSDHFPPLLK